jgi:uncharacterized membrane protein
MSVTKTILLIVFWTAIIAGSGYFFMTNVATYFTGFRSKVFGDSFFNNQFWVVMHLVGGSLALFTGPVQFWKQIRNRYIGAHRLIGKLYMFGVALVGISAFRLSLISYCRPCRVSLFILALLAVLATAFAWRAIKSRNIKAHRQFMVRSYICIVSFVAVRIDEVYPLDFFFGEITDATYRRVVNEYFFSFVPLLLAEIMMVWWPSVAKRRT